MNTASQKTSPSTKAVNVLAALVLIATTFSIAATSKVANAAGFELLDSPQNTSVSDKVEVLEFLWLGCPHCYALEPSMKKWKETKPDYVHFVREAPALNQSWEAHSRGFYAAQLAGKENEFVDAMFEAIHEDRKPMRNPKKIAELAESIGLDKDKFLSAMKGFAVSGKLNRAKQLAIGAGISSVPTVIINGKYRTSSSISGGHDGIIETINERVEFEKTEMNLE